MHRDTAVRKQKWLLFGEWYLHPKFHDVPYWKIPSLLAHSCSDGKAYGLIGPGAHLSKKHGLIKIYGKCRRCKKKVGDEAHIIINMIKTL